MKQGFKEDFDDQGAKIIRKSDGKLLATGSMTRSGFKLNDDSQSHSAVDILFMASISTWHERLAHVNEQGIRNMEKNKVVNGLNIRPGSMNKCIRYILGKSHRLPIPKKSENRSSGIVQLVHSDLTGLFEVKSVGGSRYFVSVIDDYSK